MAIAAGEPAPEFSLARADGPPFTREDLLGTDDGPGLLSVRVLAGLHDQLSVYNELLDDFAARGATLYGVSCDAMHSQTAFREQLGIAIEQLSDFEPKGAACRAFDVLHPGGFPQRALVIVGPGRRGQMELPGARRPSELPGANLIFDAL